jgi:hypothetical protein
MQAGVSVFANAAESAGCKVSCCERMHMHVVMNEAWPLIVAFSLGLLTGAYRFPASRMPAARLCLAFCQRQLCVCAASSTSCPQASS